jgi:hypothetical protein
MPQVSRENPLITDVIVIKSDGWLVGGDRKLLTENLKLSETVELNRLLTSKSRRAWEFEPQ